MAANPKGWQIVGKLVFLRDIPRKGKSENRRVFTGDLNGGPGRNFEPPTSPLSVLRSWSRSVISSRYTGCGPASTIQKLIALARSAGNTGRRRFKKSNKRWLVLGLRAERPRFPGWDFGGYAWTFAKVQVQRHQHAIFRAANARKAPNRWHPRVSRSETVLRFEKPAPRRIDAVFW